MKAQKHYSCCFTACRFSASNAGKALAKIHLNKGNPPQIICVVKIVAAKLNRALASVQLCQPLAPAVAQANGWPHTPELVSNTAQRQELQAELPLFALWYVHPRFCFLSTHQAGKSGSTAAHLIPPPMLPPYATDKNSPEPTFSVVLETEVG